MNNRREIFTGIFAALISIIIIWGSFIVATTEVKSSLAMNITATPTLTSFPTHIVLVTQRPGEPTFTPSPTEQPPSITPTSASVSCLPPAGWSAVVLEPGDTIEDLAQAQNVTVKALKQANCLVGNSLLPGTIFYVPGAPPPTQVSCGPPAGWIYYIVKKGDTLYSIGRAYRISVPKLQSANCLGTSNTIRIGQKLYVPNVSPILPSITPSKTTKPSRKPSITPSPVIPSETATSIPPSITPTPVPPTITPTIPTETASVPTSPPTELPTSTPTPTYTPTPTPTPTPNTP